MTIYTANLKESTKHILVYDKTTPICVIELPSKFSYYNTELDWVDTIKCKLEILARRNAYEYKNLSAAPIEVIITL